MGFLAAIPAMLGSIGSVMAGTATAATAASVAQGAVIGSTILGATGSIMGGLSANAQAGYRAKVAENNAVLLQKEADNSRVAGQREESMQRWKTGQLIGTEKANQAANGVDVGIGSAQLVRDSSQAMGDFDALTIRYNAARQAWGQDVEASNQLAEAKMDRSAGKMALVTSFLGAASSVTGGLGKLASMKTAGNAVGLGSRDPLEGLY